MMTKREFTAAAGRAFDLYRRGARFRMIGDDLDLAVGSPLGDADLDALESFLSVVRGMEPPAAENVDDRIDRMIREFDAVLRSCDRPAVCASPTREG